MSDLELILDAAERFAQAAHVAEGYRTAALGAIDRVRAHRVEVPIPRDDSGLEQLKATLARDGEYVTTEYMDLSDHDFNYKTGRIGMKNPTRRDHLVHADIVVVTNDGLRSELHRVEVGKLQTWADNGIERAS